MKHTLTSGLVGGLVAIALGAALGFQPRPTTHSDSEIDAAVDKAMERDRSNQLQAIALLETEREDSRLYNMERSAKVASPLIASAPPDGFVIVIDAYGNLIRVRGTGQPEILSRATLDGQPVDCNARIFSYDSNWELAMRENVKNAGSARPAKK